VTIRVTEPLSYVEFMNLVMSCTIAHLRGHESPAETFDTAGGGAGSARRAVAEGQ
jgi:hypothetical protein